jgi:hypothetical protein
MTFHASVIKKFQKSGLPVEDYMVKLLCDESFHINNLTIHYNHAIKLYNDGTTRSHVKARKILWYA